MLVNSDYGNNGIYRARLLIDSNNEARVFIPAVHNLNNIKLEELESFLFENKTNFPKAIWGAPNKASCDFQDNDNCWVAFENGDSKRPIIFGFMGNSIKEAIMSSNASNSSIDNPCA